VYSRQIVTCKCTIFSCVQIIYLVCKKSHKLHAIWKHCSHPDGRVICVITVTTLLLVSYTHRSNMSRHCNSGNYCFGPFRRVIRYTLIAFQMTKQTIKKFQSVLHFAKIMHDTGSKAINAKLKRQHVGGASLILAKARLLSWLPTTACIWDRRCRLFIGKNYWLQLTVCNNQVSFTFSTLWGIMRAAYTLRRVCLWIHSVAVCHISPPLYT